MTELGDDRKVDFHLLYMPPEVSVLSDVEFNKWLVSCLKATRQQIATDDDLDISESTKALLLEDLDQRIASLDS